MHSLTYFLDKTFLANYKGKEGFDCYVALAVLSRNIQRIGEIVQKRRRKQEARKKRKLSKAA